MSDFIKFLNDWQNLIAAIIAIGAGYFAYQAATAQTRQDRKHEQTRRSRKLAAVRAMLPLALTQIVEYAGRSAEELDGLLSLCGNEKFLPGNSIPNNLPQALPQDTLRAFAEYIEYADDIDTWLFESIVSWIQIHDSRVRGIVEKNTDPTDPAPIVKYTIEGYLIDAVSIYAAAEALYEYSRRRQAKPPTHITWENVRNSLNLLQIMRETHPDIYKIIEGREKAAQGPFETLAK